MGKEFIDRNRGVRNFGKKIPGNFFLEILHTDV
jgi:hypothetical protein